MASKKLTKKELIQILVDDYGYEREDLKDTDGKPFTNATLEAMIEQEKEDAKQLEISKNRIVEKKSAIKDDDKIAVMSGSMGAVIYRSDTSRRVWKFTRFGQIEYMPYGELVTIRNRFGGYYTDGWLVILDAQVQDEFGLTNMYKNILTPENIDEIFKKSADELEVIIDNLPDGMKNTFINKAQELYASGKLDSLRIIKLIESKFGFSLEDNAPLADII